MAYFKNIHSLAELKKEYRRLALENHPDKGGSTEVMLTRVPLGPMQAPIASISGLEAKTAILVL